MFLKAFDIPNILKIPHILSILILDVVHILNIFSKILNDLQIPKTLENSSRSYMYDMASWNFLPLVHMHILIVFLFLALLLFSCSLGDFIVEITNNKTTVGLTDEILKTEGFKLGKDGMFSMAVGNAC